MNGDNNMRLDDDQTGVVRSQPIYSVSLTGHGIIGTYNRLGTARMIMSALRNLLTMLGYDVDTRDSCCFSVDKEVIYLQED
jgi:hypothetical protein